MCYIISLSHFHQDSPSATEKLSSQVARRGGEEGEGDRGRLMTKNRKRMEGKKTIHS